MKDINSYCVICGEGYHCCISCDDQKTMSWRLITDSMNHFKVYMILCDYRDKKINKENAKKLLSQTDISGWENFKEGTKGLIKEILAEDKVVISNDNISNKTNNIETKIMNSEKRKKHSK